MARHVACLALEGFLHPDLDRKSQFNARKKETKHIFKTSILDKIAIHRTAQDRKILDIPDKIATYKAVNKIG